MGANESSQSKTNETITSEEVADFRGRVEETETMKWEPTPDTPFNIHTVSDAKIATLYNMFVQSPTLKAVAAAMAKTMETDDVVQELHIDNAGFGAHGMVLLAEVLMTNRTVKTLSLQHNNLDDQAIAPLVAVLEANPTLEVLDLSRNHEITEAGAIALIRAGSSLRSINLGLNAIEGTPELFAAISERTTLQEVDLSDNELRPNVSVLTEWIRSNKTVHTLNISTTKLGDKGTVVLADALRTDTTLRSLHLGYCGLKMEGVVALAKALEENKTLENLDLIGNGIKAKAAPALANALKVNETLKVLSINMSRAALGPDVHCELQGAY